MNTNLKHKLFRKKWNKRGFSSIIGAIFMILIVLSLASAYFFYTLSQNTNYNAAVRQQKQFDLNRISEGAQVTHARYSVNTPGMVSLTVQIKNPGPSSVNLTTLWVKVNDTNGVVSSGFQAENIIVQSGSIFSRSFNVPVTGVTPGLSYTYASWFITALGNTVVVQPVVVENIIMAQTTQGIGSLAMDFQNFVYYKIKTGNTLDFWPNGRSGYALYGASGAAGSSIAFRVNITNLDLNQRPIYLNASSVLFSIFPSSGGNFIGVAWYIVTVDASGRIQPNYNGVTLQFGQPTLIYFAAINPLLNGVQFAPYPSNKVTPGTSPVNLAVIGTIGGVAFGQNIPFVSIYINP